MDLDVHPEYRSYLDLIARLREAGFEWSWNVGDLYWIVDEESAQGGRVGLVPAPVYGDPDPLLPGVIPLPRLAYWLALLEEAGEPWVVLLHDARGTYQAGCGGWMDNWRFSAEGPTREEAAARLWCAVTGVPVE